MERRTIRDSDPTVLCPACLKTLTYKRFHAGFSDLGYMYCDSDEAVVTWEALSDEDYNKIVDQYPWSLDRAEQKAVEERLGPCPFGGEFRFANLPRCPNCGAELAELARDPIYFVVLGRRLDATRDRLWRQPKAND